MKLGNWLGAWMVLAVALLAGICWGGEPIVLDFSRADALESYLEKGGSGAVLGGADAAGGGWLELPGSSRKTTLKGLPVVGERLYRLRFTAWIEGEECVEQNDRIHIESLQGYYRPAAYELRFTGGEPAQELRLPGYREGGFLLTGTPYEYVHAFYVPAGSSQVAVTFMPNGVTTRVRTLSLEPCEDAGGLIGNPDFRHGELNYCGWRPSRDGRIYQLDEGRRVFNSGYGGVSPLFPLREGENYVALGRGVGRPNLAYYDAEGKALNTRFLFELKPGQESRAEFSPPPGSHYGRIVMYNVWLESLQVMPKP